MDLHGRDTHNPWSLREMCVYQQYDVERKQTKWILLQPPDRLIERVEGDRTIHANVLHLHILCMSVAESNWSSYINYLQMEVAREVRDPVIAYTRRCSRSPGRACLLLQGEQFEKTRLRRKLCECTKAATRSPASLQISVST